jgi:hypothetical protein
MRATLPQPTFDALGAKWIQKKASEMDVYTIQAVEEVRAV